MRRRIPTRRALRAGWGLLVVALVCPALAADGASAALPALPDDAQTRWVVGQPEEIVTYLTFDPATVERRLPRALRFITVGELAAGGVSWAKDYLNGHPAHGRWGVSFLEIIRAGTFTIDGRAPRWPERGAAALWCARVAPSDTALDLGPGRPLLVLDFWLPDSGYVAYMRGKGHYATYGNVKLLRHSDGNWQGTVDVGGLNIVAECRPTGPVTGGAGSAGMQVLFPPRSFPVKKMVRVAFAGHRVQECAGSSSWLLRGTHPLVGGVVLPPSTFQFGYDLVGGAYPW